MKTNFDLKTALFAAALLTSFAGCEQSRRTETDTVVLEGDSVTVSRNETRIRPNDELREFREWVDQKTAEADTNARRRWPKVKEDFQNRTARLDTRLDSLSAESRQEYAELKSRYEQWENKQEMRSAQPLQESTLIAWRKDLLGERRAFSTITGANAKETYLLFMGVVRAKNENWSLTDWDYVDHVYGELNARKDQIESNISAADRLKIKTLQAEYLTLEAAADAKDAYRNVKD